MRRWPSMLPFALCALVAACSGRAAENRQRLAIQGSDTMQILAQAWAQAYSTAHPDAVVEVNGGGSGVGITALINGTTDIANASRPMSDEEREALREQRSAEAHEISVALDAIAVYVHGENPIDRLTLPQLAQIYRGQVTNWSRVGGPDRPIVLYGRDNSSGTYAYFKEHVLEGRDFAVEAQSLPGTAGVIQAVSVDENGIGYGGIGYAEGVKLVSLVDDQGRAVEPTLANATARRYPLSRYLFMYTAGEPEGLTAAFVTWVLSPDGQRLVEDAGYYPLPAAEREAELEAESGGGE
ncbi:MAG: phosphate ABC transporter substrate-binding protein [Sandaracinaceae bacterium]